MYNALDQSIWNSLQLGRAIKGFVVCNGGDLKPFSFDLLKGLAQVVINRLPRYDSYPIDFKPATS